MGGGLESVEKKIGEKKCNKKNDFPVKIRHGTSFIALFLGITIIALFDLKMAMALMAIRAIVGLFGQYGYSNKK